MLKGGEARAVAKPGSFSSAAQWRSDDILHLTMIGEANEAAVLALTDRCRHIILGTHPVSPVVVIDTTLVSGLAVSPGFMRACREFLSFLKSKGARTIVGVSSNAAVRGVASAVGFGVGVRMPIAATLGEALALADDEALRVG